MGKIEELQQIRRTIEQGGGADKIKKQHESGKKHCPRKTYYAF